jgi:preprotein translocase subunit SecE
MPLPLITGLIVLATLAVVGVVAYLIDQTVDRD